MPIELKMPALSPTMEKGTLARWLIAEGDVVMSGDLVAEIETDKATMEFEAVDEGRVSHLLVAEGTDDVPVGTVIALLAQEGEDAPATAPQPLPPTSISAEPAPPSHATRTPPAERISISPLAARIAAAKQIDISGIAGSGPNGRIVRGDILPSVPATALPAPFTLQAPAATAIMAPPPAGVPLETRKLSTMRRTIARRLTEAKQTIPHFYLTARCTLDALLRLRADLNASLAPQGVKLSVNDMLIKAMGLALLRVPDANVQFGGEELHCFSRADIAMAVAIDGGLVTPVIRDVGALSLSAIAQTSKALATKARDGGLLPEDYQGGTASLSNLGMFGIDEMFPVINPPQALILGIAAGIEQPWKVDGQIALATVMAATASFDHRAIDGATAARFMAAFRDLVESPLQIVG